LGTWAKVKRSSAFVVANSQRQADDVLCNQLHLCRKPEHLLNHLGSHILQAVEVAGALSTTDLALRALPMRHIPNAKSPIQSLSIWSQLSVIRNEEIPCHTTT